MTIVPMEKQAHPASAYFLSFAGELKVKTHNILLTIITSTCYS
jgi:hypothetical protein